MSTWALKLLSNPVGADSIHVVGEDSSSFSCDYPVFNFLGNIERKAFSLSVFGNIKSLPTCTSSMH